MPREGTVAGALLGTFMGDALGAQHEGAPAARSWEEGGARLTASEAQPELVYTDDTQMMLALARHLIDEPDVDPAGLRDQFVAAYEPWRGYASGTRSLFDAWAAGVGLEEAATAVYPQGSFGNGAAMRIAPVGVRWAGDPARRRAAAARSAQVTHVHPLGVEGAVLQAEAVAHASSHHSFDRQGIAALASVARLPECQQAIRRLETLVEEPERVAPGHVVDELGAGYTAHRSVPAAWWVAATSHEPRSAAARALALGGDADTVTAMALAVLGAAHGRHWWPQEWVVKLEDEARGRTYCLELARALAASLDENDR